MTNEEAILQQVGRLAFENGRMRHLISEVITTMSHAEVFIASREKMHPTGIELWHGLLSRLSAAVEPFEPIGNESAKLEGGE